MESRRRQHSDSRAVSHIPPPGPPSGASRSPSTEAAEGPPASTILELDPGAVPAGTVGVLDLFPPRGSGEDGRR